MHERAFSVDRDGSLQIADWLQRNMLTPDQIDCITAIVLKVLDAKCKMDAEKQAGIMSVYAYTRLTSGALFHREVHEVIDQAIHFADEETMQQIHMYRKVAEASIPKAVMKSFKAFLRETLFSGIG